MINVQTRSLSKYALAFRDICEGAKKWRVWWYLSTQDIRMQYRRSVLGPLWITLSMATTIYSMGFLYGKLFKLDIAHYLPHLALGLLSWNLINTLINDGTNTFVESETYLKSMRLPYSTFVFKTVTRIFLTYFHNIVVIIPIYIFLKIPITSAMLFVPVSLLLLWINGFCFAMLLSLLNTRFRDLKPIISSVTHVIFFLTPVIWSPTLLGPRGQLLIKFNPMAQFLNLLREPFVGRFPSTYTISFVLWVTVIFATLSFIAYSHYRSRITYWL